MAQAKKYLGKPKSLDEHMGVDAPMIRVEDLEALAGSIIVMLARQLEAVKDTIIQSVYLDFGLCVNPFLSNTWNITQQGQAYKRNRMIADHMARIAGHSGAIGAKRFDAKDYRLGGKRFDVNSFMPISAAARRALAKDSQNRKRKQPA